MLTLREYALQLITLLLLLLALVYVAPRVREKISTVATAPVVKRIKPSL